MTESPLPENRQERYYNLIDQLLKCPNGQEPEVLDRQPDLLDAGLIKTLMQVATMMAHQDNQDAAKFLIYVARQLSKELGLYPQVSTES
jgi:hypothetical protein